MSESILKESPALPRVPSTLWDAGFFSQPDDSKTIFKASQTYGDQVYADIIKKVADGDFTKAYLLLNIHKDNAQGIFSQYQEGKDEKGEKQGFGCYTRDASQDSKEKFTGNANFQNFAIFGLNYLDAACKLLDPETNQKDIKTLKNQAKTFIIGIQDTSYDESKAAVAALLERNILPLLSQKLAISQKKAEKLLMKVKDYCNLDQSPYTLVTKLAIQDKDQKEHIYFQIDRPYLTSANQAIKNEFKNRTTKSWYIDLKPVEQKLVDAIATKMEHDQPIGTMPTQLRHLPGMRNASHTELVRVTTTSDSKDSKNPQTSKSEVIYFADNLATPGHQGADGDRLSALTAQQMRETLNAQHVTFNTLINQGLSAQPAEIKTLSQTKAAFSKENIALSIAPVNFPRQIIDTDWTAFYQLFEVTQRLMNHCGIEGTGELLPTSDKTAIVEFWNQLPNDLKSIQDQITPNSESEVLLSSDETVKDENKPLLDTAETVSLGDKQRAAMAQLLLSGKSVLNSFSVSTGLSDPNNGNAQLSAAVKVMAANLEKAFQSLDLSTRQSFITKIGGSEAYQADKSLFAHASGCMSCKDRGGEEQTLSVIDVIYQDINGRTPPLTAEAQKQDASYQQIAAAEIGSGHIQKKAGLHGASLAAEGFKNTKSGMKDIWPQGLEDFRDQVNLKFTKYNSKPILSDENERRRERLKKFEMIGGVILVLGGFSGLGLLSAIAHDGMGSHAFNQAILNTPGFSIAGAHFNAIDVSGIFVISAVIIGLAYTRWQLSQVHNAGMEVGVPEKKDLNSKNKNPLINKHGFFTPRFENFDSRHTAKQVNKWIGKSNMLVALAAGALSARGHQNPEGLVGSLINQTPSVSISGTSLSTVDIIALAAVFVVIVALLVDRYLDKRTQADLESDRQIRPAAGA